MGQIARSATQETWGYLPPCRYVLHDRDTKFRESFRSMLAERGVKTISLPARSPNLNAFAERWVRSVKRECLSKLILFGPARWRACWLSSARIAMANGTTKGKGISYFPRGWRCSASPTAWRPTQILWPCRMSILTIRER
jgi:transposase InsO family protein